MRREDLEHLIRAAGAISGSRRIVIIGSQAILGQFPYQAPARATLSMEADLLPMDAPDRADLLTGSIGELSPFHNTFGYFGDGVSLETARLPAGWQGRLIAIDNANTNGYVGLCLEVHDLLISKYFASREKDYEFCAAVVSAGLADREQLLHRLSETDLEPNDLIRIERRIEADFASRSMAP
ncbi:MAG TPA: DUF6036 family nucleotidyltransferase [Gammaproteobacteria bacterium]|nr:DUF6036 family nucleotidyltransferase [Gammaproteobacteria bacterium]